jgi:hypothetical protein
MPPDRCRAAQPHRTPPPFFTPQWCVCHKACYLLFLTARATSGRAIAHAAPLQSDTFSHTPTQSRPSCATCSEFASARASPQPFGELARTHMEPELAAMVVESLNITIAELKAAGADPLRPRTLARAVPPQTHGLGGHNIHSAANTTMHVRVPWNCSVKYRARRLCRGGILRRRGFGGRP